MKRSELFACKGPFSISGKFYQELEMDSLYIDSHDDTTRELYAESQHTHLFFELMCCTQGETDYLLGTKRYHVQAHSIILAPPGVIHTPLYSERSVFPYQRHVIWLSPAFIKTASNLFNAEADFMKEPHILYCEGSNWTYIERMFARCVEESMSGAANSQVCLYGMVLQLLVHLERTAQGSELKTQSDKNDMLEKILHYVQTHLGEKITLAETAQHFMISESTLSHIFSSELKIGFYRCVTQRRLLESKHQIQHGGAIDDISQAVGFTNYSVFYRAFKSEYGISPSQYRRLINS